MHGHVFTDARPRVHICTAMYSQMHGHRSRERRRHGQAGSNVVSHIISKSCANRRMCGRQAGIVVRGRRVSRARRAPSSSACACSGWLVGAVAERLYPHALSPGLDNSTGIDRNSTGYSAARATRQDSSTDSATRQTTSTETPRPHAPGRQAVKLDSSTARQ